MKAALIKTILNLNIKFNYMKYKIDKQTDLFYYLKTEHSNYSIDKSYASVYYKESIISYIEHKNKSFGYIPYYNTTTQKIKLYGHNNFLLKNSKIIDLSIESSFTQIFSSLTSSDIYFYYCYLQASLKYNQYLVTNKTVGALDIKQIINSYITKKEQFVIYLISKEIKTYEEFKDKAINLINL